MSLLDSPNSLAIDSIKIIVLQIQYMAWRFFWRRCISQWEAAYILSGNYKYFSVHIKNSKKI
jgi:hypothetical protein